MSESIRVLVVDDDAAVRRSIIRALRLWDGPVQTEESCSGEDVSARLHGVVDCVFLDYALPGKNGLEILQAARAAGVKAAFVMLTARGDEELAVAAMRAGASDYVSKSHMTADRLLASLRHALRVRQAEREAEDAGRRLRANEERLGRIVEAIADGVLILDTDGRYLFANPAAARMLGAPAEAIVRCHYTKTPWQRIHADGTPLTYEEHPYFEVMRTGRATIGLEAGVIRPDGTRAMLQVSASPLLDEQGRIEGVVTTLRDITARRQFEQALRQSEARYRELFEHAPVALWEESFAKLLGHLDELAAEGVGDLRSYLRANPGEAWNCVGMVEILDVNRAAVDFYEAPSRHGLIRGLPLISSEETLEAHIESIVATAERRRTFAIEAPQRTLKGNVKYADVRWSVAPGHEHDYGKILISIIDITQRKAAEEALRKSEEALRDSNQRLDALIKASPLGIVAMDTEFHIRTWNPAMERIFGWTEADVLGKAVPPVLEDVRGEQLPIHERILRGRTLTGMEVQQRRKDGTVVEVSVSTAAIRDGRGKIVGALGMVEDITEARRLKEQLLQAHRMETVGRLAGGVAHDFSNLLAVISGYSEAMLRRVEEGDALRKHVEEINHAAERGAALTRQLLIYSRRQSLAPQVLDLAHVVQSVHRMLRPTFDEKIEIIVRGEEGKALVMADPAQMEQVLVNLALNARDAMPGGGRLVISTGTVNLRGRSEKGEKLPAGEYVVLEVEDTGVGMDREVLPRIFEPFFTTKEGKGTGLGLSIVYEIVQQCHGRITVSSEPHKGTTFRVMLPKARG